MESIGNVEAHLESMGRIEADLEGWQRKTMECLAAREAAEVRVNPPPFLFSSHLMFTWQCRRTE